MDVRQLRHFIGVVEAGSFTAAAHRLGVAQPALRVRLIMYPGRIMLWRVCARAT
jgi:hypothetical protein